MLCGRVNRDGSPFYDEERMVQLFLLTAARFCPLHEDFGPQNEDRVSSVAADGSDAGALVRLAQGTTPGTHVGKTLTSGGAEWSTLVLSTGLDCQQSMRTVPGKAVLFGLISLVSSPYSMRVQPPWRRLLEITHLLLLTL